MPFGLFAPAPLGVLRARHGDGPFWLTALLAAAALFLGLGPGTAAGFLCAVAVPAWIVGRGLKSSWPPELVVVSVAAFLTLATYGALHLALPDGIRPWVTDLVHQTLDLYAKQGAPDATVAVLRAREARLAEVFFQMLPLATMASGMALATASLLTARLWLTRAEGPGAVSFEPLSWHLPDTWIWALIAAGLLTLVPHAWARVAGANALGVMAVCYAFQGWAVVASVFRARRVHVLVQAGFYALMLLWPVLVLALVMVGLTDVWTDLRRVRPRPEPPEE